MPKKSWILTDVASGVWQDTFAIADGDELSLAGSKKWSVKKRTMHGGMSEGVDLVEVNNGRLSFSILPTRGMGLWQGTCDGLEIGWKSPVKYPVNPAFINALDRGGLGWLSGFNEWMVRCGLDSNGSPGLDVVLNNEGHPTKTELTLHGKIANLPAHHVEVSVSTDAEGTISVTGEVDETMLFGPALRLKSTVETKAGSNRLKIIDEVTNLRGSPSEMEMLYHTNMGHPFLEAGARLVAPLLEVAPRDALAASAIDKFNIFDDPKPGYIEQVYWMELAADEHGNTLALLRNSHGEKGISLHFNKRQLPCFTLWKNTQAETDGYCTGLEPATNYPMLKTIERQHGRVVTLPVGGTYKMEMEIAIHSTAADILEVERRIAEIQKPHSPKIHRAPQPKYQAKP